MHNLVWAFGMLAFLWVAWFATGGPEGGRTDAPFLRPPKPVDTGTLYGPRDLVPTGKYISRRSDLAAIVPPSKTPGANKEISKKDTPETKPIAIKFPTNEILSPIESIIPKEAISLFGGKVSFTFRGRTGARLEDPTKEYIEVIASSNNSQPINITGWKIRSTITGKSAIIEKGTYLPYSGRVNEEERIFLIPGEKVIIATGRSPIGVSFRLNTCTGYFEQFQDFSPSLPLQCPYPKNEELPPLSSGISDHCLDFIERLPRCKVYIKALPLSFANDPVCQEHITRKITYNTFYRT